MNYEEIWIAFKDDDDEIIRGYVKLVEQKDGLLTFITNNNNEITIPNSRLIKIKRNRDGVER